jgi:hypothetical protein
VLRMYGHGWLQSTYVEDSMTEALAVQLDFAALVESTAVVDDSALGFSVSVALEMQPKEALACFAAATHEVCLHCTILRPPSLCAQRQAALPPEGLRCISTRAGLCERGRTCKGAAATGSGHPSGSAAGQPC